MEIDGSSVQVTLTLMTNGYFVQLLHVSPYKDSITPNLFLAIHRVFLTTSGHSSQCQATFHCYFTTELMQNKNQHLPIQSYSQPV